MFAYILSQKPAEHQKIIMAHEFRTNFYSSIATLDNDVTSSGLKTAKTSAKPSEKNLTYLSTHYETDRCITITMLAIICVVSGELLDRIIDKNLTNNCHGCVIDHRVNSNTWLKYTLVRDVYEQSVRFYKKLGYFIHKSLISHVC